MPRNFVLIYQAREGSSAIMEQLQRNDEVVMPLFEELDWYLLKELPVPSVAELLDRTFKTGNYQLARNTTLLPRYISHETKDTGKCIGFKWRIWGESDRIANVLRDHDVVVFHLLRSNLLNYSFSTYLSEQIVPLTKNGKNIGIKSGDQLQFYVSELPENERREFQQWLQSLRPTADIDVFCRIATEYVEHKKWVEDNFISGFRQKGLEVHTLRYEDLASDSDKFFARLRDIIGLSSRPVTPRFLKKVSPKSGPMQLQNLEEIERNLRYRDLSKTYDEFCEKIQALDTSGQWAPSSRPSGSQSRHLSCPYMKLLDRSFWSRAVAKTAFKDIDLLDRAPFTVTSEMKIATAGSCFAQNISRYLSRSGFNFFVTEPGPTFISKYASTILRSYNYAIYSARYGNIYTARQLVQLFDRAFGAFEPADTSWEDRGRFVDPYRPQIQPRGFETVDELHSDRLQHLAAVRRMFCELDIFVFTLGLTETYVSKLDGAVYPVCPGCGAGTYDADQHQFTNFDYGAVVEDLEGFIQRLKSVNAAARTILTVSPVPLVATAEPRHVLQSTTYSKSVLRAAAGWIADKYSEVAYFPSYDLIASPAGGAQYFAGDQRTVREEGIAHAMRMFFKHFCDRDMVQPGDQDFNVSSASVDAVKRDQLDLMARFAAVCDEEQLDRR